jgi:hypothetical protein
VKLTVRHTFDCTPETFWQMYWDDGFDAMLRKDSTVEREVVEERIEGGIEVKRLRFTPAQELPTPVAKLIGSSKLVYDQENRWDPSARIMKWQVIPTILPGKLEARGSFTVEARPGDRCEMLVDGDITVNVRFIGGRIESAVVDEVQKSYDHMAETIRDWLQQHRS